MGLHLIFQIPQPTKNGASPEEELDLDPGYFSCRQQILRRRRPLAAFPGEDILFRWKVPDPHLMPERRCERSWLIARQLSRPHDRNGDLLAERAAVRQPRERDNGGHRLVGRFPNHPLLHRQDLRPAGAAALGRRPETDLAPPNRLATV